MEVNKFISVFAFIGLAVQFVFVYNFFNSIFNGRRSSRNPWRANTLEWTAPVHGIHGNWPGEIPHVYRWPYDYSRPDIELDYLPQTMSDEDILNKIDYTSEDYDPTLTDAPVLVPEEDAHVETGHEIVMLNLINRKKKSAEDLNKPNDGQES